jgi:hypothetical protein
MSRHPTAPGAARQRFSMNFAWISPGSWLRWPGGRVGWYAANAHGRITAVQFPFSIRYVGRHAHTQSPDRGPPPLNRLAGIDFGPIFIEYPVHLIIASATAAALADVDDAFPLVGHQCARADILDKGRPRKE